MTADEIRELAKGRLEFIRNQREATGRDVFGASDQWGSVCTQVLLAEIAAQLAEFNAMVREAMERENA